MIKIPSKFLSSFEHHKIYTIYINILEVVCISVEKRQENVWDSKTKKITEKVEIVNDVTIQMSNNYYVPIKQLNDSEFEEFIIWFDRNMGLEKIRDK